MIHHYSETIAGLAAFAAIIWGWIWHEKELADKEFAKKNKVKPGPKYRPLRPVK
jgi:hypothetical protein